MGRAWVVALLFACPAAIAATGQRYTSHAEAVRVDVLVTDGKRPVRGLTAANFEVRDNGVPQAIARIDTEQLPINVIAALDTSGSVAGPKLHALTGATRALLDGLTPADKAALLSFSGRVLLRVPLTSRHDEVRAALGGIAAHGRTALRDAAFAALALRQADDTRTLVLLFSDGADTSSWLTTDKVAAVARRADVVVYPVGVRLRLPSTIGLPRARAVYLDQSSVFLRDLADATGGRVMMAANDADLHDTFVAVLKEFRERYVLYYAPSGVQPLGWHQLDVRLKGARGKVVARRGYFAE